MFVDTCYGQRTVLAGFMFSIVGGQGWAECGALGHLLAEGSMF